MKEGRCRESGGKGCLTLPSSCGSPGGCLPSPRLQPLWKSGQRKSGSWREKGEGHVIPNPCYCLTSQLTASWASGSWYSPAKLLQRLLWAPKLPCLLSQAVTPWPPLLLSPLLVLNFTYPYCPFTKFTSECPFGNLMTCLPQRHS